MRVRNFAKRMDEAVGKADAAPGPAARAAEGFLEKFTDAVDDDLNMSRALGSVFDFMREVNRVAPVGADARAAVEALRRADEILGILGGEVADGEGDAEIDALAREREAARKNRDFARSDEIRDELAKRGVILEDTADGTRWYRK